MPFNLCVIKLSSVSNCLLQVFSRLDVRSRTW